MLADFVSILFGSNIEFGPMFIMELTCFLLLLFFCFKLLRFFTRSI